MALRINTNVSALSAHKNMIKNDNSLSSSLEKLSSGLRINRAADDASGMAIADSLRSQALGLGQAIRNANDGISMVQTADGALEESIKIVNSVKTKSIQSAQDGQTTESRKAIQSDVDKLLEELDMIARTTSFNNQKLLSGNFSDKKFQVGAYSGETVAISIGSSESNKIGHVTTGNLELTNDTGGTVQLSVFSNLQSQAFTVQAVDIKYDNSRENSMGALADAINKLSDVLGISADANVRSTSRDTVAEGTTGSDFKINGTSIGTVAVSDADSDGALVKAINSKTADTGVLASTDAEGKLTLNSTDGRAIKVTGSTGDVLAGSDMSTVGSIQLKQYGSNELLVTDLASGSATDFQTDITTTGTTATTSIDSTLTAGSALGSGTTLKAGVVLGADVVEAQLGGAGAAQTTTQDSMIKSGSVVASGTVVESGSTFGGEVSYNGATNTTTGDSLLTAGSVLASGTILKAGTLVTTDLIAEGGSTVAAGSVLSADTTISGNVTLGTSMIVTHDSTLATGGKVATGSMVGADLTMSGDLTLTEDMTFNTGTEIALTGNTSFKAGSVYGADATTSAAITTTQEMTLKAGSTILSGSTIATGSTLGGEVQVGAALTAQGAVTLSEGSTIGSGTVLEAGTVLTSDITVQGGDIIEAGTTLEQKRTLSGDVSLDSSMTIAKDSVLAQGSKMAANGGGVSGTTIEDTTTDRLSSLNVLTQEDAQIAISVADSALKDLDKIRSDLGSVQNQLTSTISNISVTRVNIFAAESSIRDVDFAEEASNFSRMQILNQAGSFAMAQANASSQNVLSLLKG